jgi:hypothetical protein
MKRILKCREANIYKARWYSMVFKGVVSQHFIKRAADKNPLRVKIGKSLRRQYCMLRNRILKGTQLSCNNPVKEKEKCE